MPRPHHCLCDRGRCLGVTGIRSVFHVKRREGSGCNCGRPSLVYRGMAGVGGYGRTCGLASSYWTAKHHESCTCGSVVPVLSGDHGQGCTPEDRVVAGSGLMWHMFVSLLRRGRCARRGPLEDGGVGVMRPHSHVPGHRQSYGPSGPMVAENRWRAALFHVKPRAGYLPPFSGVGAAFC